MRKTTPKLLRNFHDQHNQPAPPQAPPPRPAFGRGQRPELEEETAFDLNALRDGGAPPPEPRPRWLLPAAAICAACMALGGIYFIHATLAFQDALASNATLFSGPYPSGAVLLFAFPALCGLGYFLLDYLRLKTGIAPFSTPQGRGMTVGAALLMLLLLQLSGMLIRHMDDAFAAQRGYAWCSSPFDPAHQHVYALQSYITSYGCPTVAPPR